MSIVRRAVSIQDRERECSARNDRQTGRRRAAAMPAALTLSALTPDLLALQPADLLQQPAVLDAQTGCVTASARGLLGEGGEDSTQVLETIEQLLPLDARGGDLQSSG